jgi:hypothetical protein
MPSYHLTLIGAQALPAYNGILYRPVNRVFLFHSNDTEQIALNIQAVLQCDSMLVAIENPFDYKECKEKIENRVKHSGTDDWTFNISGGSKIMTIAALDVAREKKLPVFFIDQNNKITDLQTYKQTLFEVRINLQVYFRLFGQSAKSTILLKDIDIEYFNISKLIFQNFQKISPLFNEFRKKGHNTGKSFMLKNNHFELKWDKEKKEAMLFEETSGQETYMIGSLIFDILFHTAWFELVVIDVIKQWARAKQIYWHTVFPSTTTNTLKNEIDVIIDTGAKLFFIECKTKVHDVTDLDKFRNVVKNFGGLSAKHILVTYVKPDLKVLEKCSDNKIQVFWFEDMKTNQKNPPSKLIELLDKEYQSINPI